MQMPGSPSTAFVVKERMTGLSFGLKIRIRSSLLEQTWWGGCCIQCPGHTLRLLLGQLLT